MRLLAMVIAQPRKVSARSEPRFKRQTLSLAPRVSSFPPEIFLLRIPDSNQDANDGNDAAAGDLDITSDVTIEGGNRVSISAQDIRLFQVHEGAHFAVDQVALRDGHAHYSHAGGGAVFNQGSFRLTNGALFDNFGEVAGGGLLNHGTAELADVTIARNAAFYVGGAGVMNEGQLTVTRALLEQNEAQHGTFGGGLYNNGRAEIVDSTIRNNSGIAGGGIRLDDGLVVLTDVTITGNQESGVYKTGGSLVREGKTVIRDNEPENCAGC